MFFKQIAQILGKYLFYLSIALCIPLFTALYFQYGAPRENHPQPHSTSAFFWTLVITLSSAAFFHLIGRNSSKNLYRRESILLVVLIWIVTAMMSALPFYFSRTLTHPLDAFFESMSALTTTGASVLSPKLYHSETEEEIPKYITHSHTPHKTYSYYGTIEPIRDCNGFIVYSGVEAVSRALLLWRSLLQWMGGMGIVVIFLTVFPILGVGGKFLYQIEMTGPIKDGLTPRVRETAIQLGKLYLSLTGIEILLLMLTNGSLPFFDALCISLSNISTGGFSIRNDSIASYQNPATEAIVFLFMILGSINFSLYFHALRFKFFRVYVPDFFLFLFTGIGASFLITFFLWKQGEFQTLSSAFFKGSFQAFSMQTTTGFVISDYDRWPFACQMILLLLMFVGGMSGSTAGGIKTSRFYILYKIVIHRLESIYRPDSIRKLYIGPSEIDDKNSQTVLAFFCIVLFSVVLGTTLLIFDAVDPETALGLIASFLNNVGAAFHAAGPTDSVAFLSSFSKSLAIFWMLLGRLEYFVMLLLFLPAFWKNK